MIGAVLLLLLAALGHAAIWIAVLNRTHASGWPHSLVKKLNLVFFLFLLVPPPLFALWIYGSEKPEHFMPWHAITTEMPRFAIWLAIDGYLILCWIAAAIALVQRFRFHFLQDVADVLRFHRSRNVADRTRVTSDDHPHHYLVHLPGNESLELDLTERGLNVPRLPPALDGLSIVHLSDFHFTGHVGKPYFEEVVRMSNALEPEIVALTGDLVDKTHCIDWIPETFGRLKAKYGVYFIFGNHDLRVDSLRVRKMLEELGIVYVGGRSMVIEVRGQPILLAGNELPWFKPAADIGKFPPRSEVPFRIVLAHSPDQFAWAREADADLMLAGHTHGGQIRLPLLGPIFAPSNVGVQYASGLFYAAPTILNVSRGLSGELPVRMNCAPEMIHLTLHCENNSPPRK